MEFYFKCEVDFTEEGYSSGIHYVIDYLFNGIAVASNAEDLTANRHFTMLPDELMKGRMGQTVYDYKSKIIFKIIRFTIKMYKVYK